MTTRLADCGCRWCADEHPGGLVLFVTIPENRYVLEVIPGREANINRHTFGRLMIPPGGLGGRDIDDVIDLRIPWATDNGSFNVFNRPKYEEMMDHLADRPYCHFTAAPDVVWNKYEPKDRHLSAIRTIERFLEWAPYIKDRALPAAMVAQDGLERYDDDIPWDQIDAWFVGGSDAWKTGAESEHYIKEALARGLWVHVGRVSGVDRIRWVRAVGASSFDGSAFGRFRDSPDKNDGLGRLQAGLINAAGPVQDRLFVTDLDGSHTLSPHKEETTSDR